METIAEDPAAVGENAHFDPGIVQDNAMITGTVGTKPAAENHVVVSDHANFDPGVALTLVRGTYRRFGNLIQPED